MAIFGDIIQEHFVREFRSNSKLRTRKLNCITTREQAEEYIAEQKEKVRKTFQFPAVKCPLNPRVTDKVQFDDFTLEKIVIDSRPDFPVTMNLYLPVKIDGQIPASLVLCGHSNDGKACETYYSLAQTIARHGGAALVIDPIHQGERLQCTPDKDSGLCNMHNRFNRKLKSMGDNFCNWRIYDAVRGLDYLLTRPEIDPARVGVHGNSGGGTLATWVSAVDDRFFAAAPSCFVTTWVYNIENELPSDIEQCPPNAMKYGLEIADFLIAAAPRPFLLLGQKNDFFDPRGIQEVRDELKGLYRLLGCEDRIDLCIGPTSHGLSVTLREAAYDFFCRQAGVENPSKTEGTITPPENQDTFAAPGGEVTNLLDERKVHDLILEQTTSLKKARKVLTLPEICRILINCMGMDEPVLPHYRVLRSCPPCGVPSVTVRRFGLETEPGRVMCVLHLFQKLRFHFADSEKILLCIPHQDSVAEFAEHQTEDQMDIYGLDVRGIGECTPTTCNMPAGANFFDSYGFDFHYAALGGMLGQSILGGRVKDILCTVELLSQYSGHIELEGHGIGGIPALIAAVLSDKIQALRLFGTPESWESMIIPAEPDAESSPMSYMISGIMKYFDLPDLRAAIADKIRL